VFEKFTNLGSGGPEAGISGGRGAGLSYSRSGRGEVALLIHGNLAGKSWWRDVMSQPAAGYRYVAPDLPGFGQSGKGPGFHPSIRSYAASLMMYMDYEGIDRAALVGHSLGGAVAMELISRAPDRFTALMLVDSVSPGGLHTPFYYYPYLRALRGDRGALQWVLHRAMPSRTPPYFEELVDEAGIMHPASFAGNAQALDDWKAGEKLRCYGGPVKILSGQQDSLTSRLVASETADTFSSASSTSVVRLPGVGHSPQIEAPEDFGSELSDLLHRAA
jgi:pimeloyl-ACP methyl ester carboxylesterase